jgi:hypothetical protein
LKKTLTKVLLCFFPLSPLPFKMTSNIVFPQRPNNNSSSGIQTPNLPQPGSQQIDHQSIRDFAPGNELEVVVLRPIIRPPTYEEVASGKTQSVSPPSPARTGNFNFSTSSSVAVAANSRNLPSPVNTPQGYSTYYYQNLSSVTLNPNQQQQKQSASYLCTCADGGLVDSGNNRIASLNNVSTIQMKSSQKSSTNKNNAAGEPAASSSPHRNTSPRKLACWTVGKNGEASIPSLKFRTIGDTVKGCLATNDARPLTGQELKVDWKRICALRAGRELYKLRPPYVDRDEFGDPLRFTSELKNSGVPTVVIPSGYVCQPRKDGKWDYVAWGVRPTAKENVEVALKPTQVDPMQEKFALAGTSFEEVKNRQLTDHSGTNHANEILRARRAEDGLASGTKVTSHHPNNAIALREAAAVPLNLPPSNPIIEEADRRLQQRGFGGLAQVGRASDEAVSHLLKVCGFPDAQRLVILWEIRKAKHRYA